MNRAKKILITGGSGMIGSRLTTLLTERGHDVAHLSRSKKENKIKTFLWNPDANEVDEDALKNAEVIVHLAGAGVADKRWNGKWKNEILLSRTRSTALLREMLQKQKHDVETFICASGIGIYGLKDDGDEFIESDKPGTDFMASVATAWEREVDKIDNPGVRIVKLRIGVVLSDKGGALMKLAQPVKLLVGAPLGSGEQWVNWIHIDDLCRIFIKAIEDPVLQGVYNAVAPHPVTNKTLTKAIAKALKKPLWLPPIPRFIIRIIAGEVSGIVLNGGRVSSKKIENAGFVFHFTKVENALAELLPS
jgi:uncharacterized protein